MNGFFDFITDIHVVGMILFFLTKIVEFLFSSLLTAIITVFAIQWGVFTLLGKRFLNRVPVHLIRIRTRKRASGDLRVKIEYRVMTITTLEELTAFKRPILVYLINKYAKQSDDLVIRFPVKHRGFLFDRLVSDISEILTGGPIQGSFFLYVVKERAAPTQANRIVLIEEGSLLNFLNLDHDITSERESSFHRVLTLEDLAWMTFDSDGSLPMYDGVLRGDREFFAQVSDTNSDESRPVVGYYDKSKYRRLS